MQDWLAGLPAWLEIDTLGRLLLALVLGTAVGFEREMRGKAAGLRTVILITVGAELFTEASLLVATMRPHDLIRADPGRIAAQIVSGVGFIGAGTILVHRGAVTGLTTAASLWVAAAIGTMVGLRGYAVAAGGTVLVLVTLEVLAWFKRLLPDIRSVVLRVTIARGPEELSWVDGLLAEADPGFVPLELRGEADALHAAFRVRASRARLDALVRRLFSDPRVEQVKME